MSKKKTLWTAGGVIGSILTAFMCVLMVIALTQPHGKKLALNEGSELFYTEEVTKADAEKLAKFFNDDFIKPGNPKFTSQLTKVNGVHQVRMVIKQERLAELEVPFMVVGSVISNKVFDNSAMEVHLCDDKLNTLKVIPIRSTATAAVR